jgi:BlaI family penicillinase repressor
MEPPEISPTEWTVMEVLWKTSPRTATEVFKDLRHSTGWALNTVRTMLSRLVEKGAVVATKQPDAVTEFSAAVARQELVKAESQSFLQRVFKGAESALLLHFVQNSQLTPEQAQKLKRLVEEASKRKP